jgi:hypothetical protein
MLDDENLVKCKEVCKSWSFFMDGERFFWKQIIKKLVGDYDDFQKAWKVALKNADIEILKELGCVVKSFYSIHPSQCLDKENCKHRAIPIFSFTFVCGIWYGYTLQVSPFDIRRQKPKKQS